MIGSFTSDPAVSRLIEKQMRNWELSRAQRQTDVVSRRGEVQDFVALSRMVGSGGGDVARLLGERLGWAVFDRQILQAMAGNDEIHRRLYESMDERDLGWFEETIRSLMQGKYGKNDYFRRLTATILSLARQARAVFLGRAADLILPDNRGLRVRIVAPEEQCIQNFAQQQKLRYEAAREELQRIEQDRAQFMEHHFHVQAADQTRHDLIINLKHWSRQDALELILAAMKIRRLLT